MKQLSLVLFLFAICRCGFAQDSTKTKSDSTEEIEIICPAIPFEGEFKSGDSAWQKYIEQNLVYPRKAKRKKIHGIVTIGFILSKDGFPFEVKALSGPEELRQSAIDVVKKSPKWWPAIQGGRQVKTFKKRDIVFKLERE